MVKIQNIKKVMKLWPAHHCRTQPQSNYSNCGPHTTDDHNHNSTTIQADEFRSITPCFSRVWSFYPMKSDEHKGARPHPICNVRVLLVWWPPSFFDRKGPVAKKIKKILIFITNLLCPLCSSLQYLKMGKHKQKKKVIGNRIKCTWKNKIRKGKKECIVFKSPVCLYVQQAIA